MKNSLRISGVFASLVLAAGVAQAAGLGRMAVLSTLGQPLRVEIELLSVEPDELGSLEARLASQEAFRQARIERAAVLAGLSFAIDKRAGQQPVLRISSSTPMSEPFLDILIELNWNSGRVLREYTVLLDPAESKTAAEEPALPVTAPEAMPAEGVAPPQAATAAAAVARTYGPVKAGETLRGIASKVVPPDVTLDMMVAGLYESNRKAFARDNMNLLRQGKTLAVPERDAVMRSFSPHQARQLIRQHTQAWEELRGRVAAQPAVAEATPDGGSRAAGSIVPARVKEAPVAAAAAKDVLRLSQGKPAATARAAAEPTQRIQALEEQLTARSRALQEAQERVSQLERTVRDLQQLMDMKRSQPTPPAAPAPTPPVQVAPPAPKAVAPAPVAPPPVEEKGWFDAVLGNALYIGGLVAALLLAIFLGVYMRGKRRQKGLSNFEQSVMSGADQLKTTIFKTNANPTVPGGTGTQPGSANEFSRLGLGSIDTHEVDPIAEAEVYMAYGRDAQAEEILKEAHAKDPTRHEVVLKLLEIYAARQDTLTFETLASDLYASLGGQANETWMKVAEMGRRIDPNNPLYRVPAGQDKAITPIPDLPLSDAAAAKASTGDGVVIEFDIGDKFAPASPEATVVDQPVAATAPEDQPLDFDFGDLALGETVAQESPVVGEGTFPGFAAGEGFAATEDIQIEAPRDSGEGAASELDISPPGAELPPSLAETEARASDAAAPSASFAVGAELSTAPPVAEVSLPNLDFTGIDLDLGVEPTTSAADTSGKAAEVDIDLPGEIDADIREEVNTKLDLAKAYLEMGDKEGAKEILQEILAEGDSRQRQEASGLLAETA